MQGGRTPTQPYAVCVKCKTRPPRSGRAHYCQECLDTLQHQRRLEHSRRQNARLRAARYADRKCEKCQVPIPIAAHGNERRCRSCADAVYRARQLRKRSSSTAGDRPDYKEVRPCRRCRKNTLMHSSRQRLCDSCLRRSTVQGTPERRRLAFERKLNQPQQGGAS